MENLWLVWTAVAVAILHSIEFDHWLPYVVAAKTKHWRTGFTLLMALTGAVAHLISTSFFGVALILLGEGLTKHFQNGIQWLIGLIVVVIGLIFLIRGVRTIRLGIAHGEHCSHGERKFLEENQRDSIFLGAVFGLRPCLEALPIILAASHRGWAISLMTLTGWALASVIGMVGIVWLGLYGMERLKFKWLERYNELLTGVIIIAIGIYSIWG